MNIKNLPELWKRYKNLHKQEDRDELIKEYVHIVRYIAGRMAISLPDHIQYEDLFSSGVMGLMNAIEKYEPERKIPFEYFANQRVKGAILDDLRKMDWVPRSVRKKARDMEKALMKLQHKLGRAPSDEEFAEYLDIPVDDLSRLYDEVKGVNLLSLQDSVYDDENNMELISFIKNKKILTPEESLEKKELYEEVTGFISALKEKERLVIALYYYEGLTLKEIGHVLDISESRVCQIHTKAIMSLKVKIKSFEKKGV